MKCNSRNTTHISSKPAPSYERPIITPLFQITDLIVENYKCNKCGAIFEISKKL